MKQVAETWPLSLCEKMCEARKKSRQSKLFCPPLPVFQFSICPRCLDICWMLFQWVLFFQTLAPVCSGLQTSTADFLFGFKSHVSKRLRWQAVRMQPRLWNITTCLKGSIVSLSSASQSFVVPLRFRHEPVDAMPAPRRILQHPVLSRVEEWNWTAMHEDHACMLYLNPFVSATNDHQLGEMVTIIGSSEAIALEQVEGYKRILYIADQSLSLIGSNWINRIFASLIHANRSRILKAELCFAVESMMVCQCQLALALF